MSAIETAIAAFEENPTDEHAEDLYIEIRSPAFVAFARRPDGVPIPERLYEQLGRVHSVLRNVDAQTDLIRHYADRVLFYKNILQARDSGNHEEVNAILERASKE